MEGAHISNSNDAESGLDTKTEKDKDKKRKFEFRLLEKPDKEAAGEKRRHLAHEAVKLESQEQYPAPSPPESLKSPEKDTETVGMTPAERQYAAQVIRRENRLVRHDVVPDSNLPPTIEAGDILVEEWDDRIESGQDIDSAMEQLIETHALNEDLEVVLEPDHGEATYESPLVLGDDEVRIDHSEQHANRPQVTQESEPTEIPSIFDRWRNTTEPTEADIDELLSGTQRPQEAPKPSSKVERRIESAPASASLLQSVVGNFIGHRRGSIKNEKKLLPIQKTLESQVSELAQEIKHKEATLRSVAAEHVRRNGIHVVETLETQSQKVHSELETQRPLESTALYPLPQELEDLRISTKEARFLHGPLPAEERIGHVIIGAETPKKEPESLEVIAEKANIKLPENKRVESLSRHELIALSAHIEVEGTTLRDIFETHLIGEHALRRLVAEHLSGGDVSKALKREIVEHEIDFERDPALRDSSAAGEGEAQQSATMNAPGKESLNNLLQKAEAGMTEADDPLAYFKDPEKKSAEKEVKQKPFPKKYKRADVIMGSTIVALVVAILVLYLWRM